MSTRVDGADCPVRHRRHGDGFSGGELLPDAGRADGLDVDIGFGQAGFGEHAQERVIGGVGVGQRRHGFALELARRFNLGVFVADQLHQRAGAQHRHRLDRNALRPRDDGCVANRATDHGVARTDLFGHVHTAAPSDELHVQPFGGVITFGLRQHPGAESRQGARRGQQIRHLLELGVCGQRREQRRSSKKCKRCATGGDQNWAFNHWVSPVVKKANGHCQKFNFREAMQGLSLTLCRSNTLVLRGFATQQCARQLDL